LLAGVLQLGQYALNKKSTDTEEYLQVIENPNDKGNYNHVLKIAFESTEGNIVYRGVEYEEFSSKKINNYAYKREVQGWRCNTYFKVYRFNEDFKQDNDIF